MGAHNYTSLGPCTNFEPVFTLNLVANGGGLLLTLVSIICIATNITIEKSITRILLSFSVANVFGNIMLICDTVQLLCAGTHHKIGFVVTITAMLSISHVMLLTLAEYIILTCRTEKKAGNYNGLLLLSWIISVAGGSIDVVTTVHTAKTFFAVMFTFAILFISVKYYLIIWLHIKKQKLRKTYETFLAGLSHRRKVGKKYWKLKYFTLIIFSYIICSLPWLANELREGLQTDADLPNVHSLVLIIYSLSFYFPSTICIYLKYQEWISERGEHRGGRPTSYRYRDAFLPAVDRHSDIDV